jgi:hypothetical protein
MGSLSFDPKLQLSVIAYCTVELVPMTFLISFGELLSSVGFCRGLSNINFGLRHFCAISFWGT